MSWKKYDIIFRILSVILMVACLVGCFSLKVLSSEAIFANKLEGLDLCIVIYLAGTLFNIISVYWIMKDKLNDVIQILASCIMLAGVILSSGYFVIGGVAYTPSFLLLILANIMLVFVIELDAIVSFANVFYRLRK